MSTRSASIDLAAIYARFEMPIPKRVALPSQQGLLLNPERGLIVINENDQVTRQRFTDGSVEYHRRGKITLTSAR